MFLAAPDLIDLARWYADEVWRGAYPFIDFDPEQRWHQRVYRDRRMDVWLISWLPCQGTELHDHGGSSGAFSVLAGVLTEAVVSGGVVRDRPRRTGDSVGFGPHYVHDVRNLSDSPAVSVHAYSPPLTSMTYYDLAGGRLAPVLSVATDDPEPAADVRCAS